MTKLDRVSRINQLPRQRTMIFWRQIKPYALAFVAVFGTCAVLSRSTTAQDVNMSEMDQLANCTPTMANFNKSAAELLASGCGTVNANKVAQVTGPALKNTPLNQPLYAMTPDDLAHAYDLAYLLANQQPGQVLVHAEQYDSATKGPAYILVDQQSALNWESQQNLLGAFQWSDATASQNLPWALAIPGNVLNDLGVISYEGYSTGLANNNLSVVQANNTPWLTTLMGYASVQGSDSSQSQTVTASNIYNQLESSLTNNSAVVNNYQSTTGNSYTIGQAITNQVGNCQDIAPTYATLLNNAGISAQVVVTPTHEFVQATVDGKLVNYDPEGYYSPIQLPVRSYSPSQMVDAGPSISPGPSQPQTSTNQAAPVKP